LRARPKAQKAELVKDFSAFALAKFADGSFKPIIDRTFSLAEAWQAHEFMASKKNKGKIILKM
jgi:NADPH:quinone reductase-like Zn-dependent oxidoreductase